MHTEARANQPGPFCRLFAAAWFLAACIPDPAGHPPCESHEDIDYEGVYIERRDHRQVSFGYPAPSCRGDAGGDSRRYHELLLPRWWDQPPRYDPSGPRAHEFDWQYRQHSCADGDCGGTEHGRGASMFEIESLTEDELTACVYASPDEVIKFEARLCPEPLDEALRIEATVAVLERDGSWQ